ncbi:MAG: amino acid-binding protein, partial [Propionibacteriaceae bacterium]|nr:amino acid-binding protein [Propionibacteriaceae bacterium]
MFLLRLQLPESPGTLGQVASAVGAIGGNICSLEIIDRGPDWAIDDFIVELPGEVMPDTLVSACQSIPGVQVLWVSRHHAAWRVESDTAVLNRMAENPEQAGQILAAEAPLAFRSTWAALLDWSTQPTSVI